MSTIHIFPILLAYFMGSIPFGFLIGKAQGIDIRQYGSGNIGTTNVGRILGKKAAVLTLLGDGLKGLIPVLLAKIMLPGEFAWLAAVGLAAIVGHNWPIFLKFKGGKGVTTTYAAYLGLAWLPALVTIAVWAIISKVMRKASVAALISGVCAPVFALIFQTPGAYIVYALLGGALIYLRHIENIKRLLSGTERLSNARIPTGKNEEKQAEKTLIDYDSR